MSKQIGLLIDFDGVVVNSEPLYEKAMNVIFLRYNIQVCKNDWLFFKGKDASAVFAYLEKTFKPGVTADVMRREFTSELYVIFREKMKFIPGFVDFYKRAREICSDSIVTSTARDVMEWTFKNTPVDNIFSYMITSDEVENTKPHPEPYLKGAELLGIPIERCIVLEDSVNGIRSGKAAGAFVIGIASTFSADIISEADYIIHDYNELSNELLLNFINER